MKNKRCAFDERKPLHKTAKYYQERLIKFSDVSYKYISNDRAKYILGRLMRLPTWLQTITLNDMEKVGLIRRDDKRGIEILPV